MAPELGAFHDGANFVVGGNVPIQGVSSGGISYHKVVFIWDLKSSTVGSAVVLFYPIVEGGSPDPCAGRATRPGAIVCADITET
jgi:hypothetical protein